MTSFQVFCQLHMLCTILKILLATYKILWEPPTLDSDELDSQNIKRDARIIHCAMYITTKSQQQYKFTMLQGHLLPLEFTRFLAVSGFRWQQ